MGATIVGGSCTSAEADGKEITPNHLARNIHYVQAHLFILSQDKVLVIESDANPAHDSEHSLDRPTHSV